MRPKDMMKWYLAHIFIIIYFLFHLFCPKNELSVLTLCMRVLMNEIEERIIWKRVKENEWGQLVVVVVRFEMYAVHFISFTLEFFFFEKSTLLFKLLKCFFFFFFSFFLFFFFLTKTDQKIRIRWDEKNSIIQIIISAQVF